MTNTKTTAGKTVPILLVIIILLIAALAAGYYISFMRYEKKAKALDESFKAFEGKYEKVLSTLHSGQMEIQAYIEEKEGKTAEETKNLRMMGILLKAKGEIISSKMALSRDEKSESLGYLDSAISVLKEAFDMADEATQVKIEDLRLRLATIKGILEVNSPKAQKELDKLWREIDAITGE